MRLKQEHLLRLRIILYEEFQSNLFWSVTFSFKVSGEPDEALGALS